jgi:hypothetical protein
MLSRKLFFSSAPLVLLLTTAHTQEPTYWISQSCKDIEGFEDALKEVIWSSGEIVNSFSERDVRLEAPLRWLFNIELNNLEHKPQLDMMIGMTSSSLSEAVTMLIETLAQKRLIESAL